MAVLMVALSEVQMAVQKADLLAEHLVASKVVLMVCQKA